MSYYQGFPEYRGRIGVGFVAGVGLNLMQGLLLFLVMLFGSNDTKMTALIVGLGGWGLIQLVYMIPIYIHLRRAKRPETAKGLLIAASLVLLMNGGCWALMGPR